MAANTTAVRIVNPRAEAVATIKELQRLGFDIIDKLSIVGKDYHSKQRLTGTIGTHNSCERMQDWETLGAFWGNLWGLLSRSGFFYIPGIGPVIVFGPLGDRIIRARRDGGLVGGLNALGAGLCSIGIPKHRIIEYERALQSHKFIVIAHSKTDEMFETNGILQTPGTPL